MFCEVLLVPVEFVHVEVVNVPVGPILIDRVGDHEFNVPFGVGFRLYLVDDPLNEGELLKYALSCLFELLLEAGELELRE